MGGDGGRRWEPSEPGYVGGFGTRFRGWIALFVYGLAWGVAALFLAVGSLAGGLDAGVGEALGFVLLFLALGPLVLWLVVKPLCALGRGLASWIGGHRVPWALLLGLVPVAAFAWAVGAARGTGAVPGAVVLGAATLLPAFATYAALRPSGEVRRSRLLRWLPTVLLGLVGIEPPQDDRNPWESEPRRPGPGGDGYLRDPRFDRGRPPLL